LKAVQLQYSALYKINPTSVHCIQLNANSVTANIYLRYIVLCAIILST